MSILQILYNQLFRRRTFEAKIREFNVTNNPDGYEVDLVLEGESLRAISGAVASIFRESGAANYLEWTMFDKATMRSYTLTVRPLNRPTPHEVNAKMRDALKRVIADDPNAKEIAVQAFKELGYPCE